MDAAAELGRNPVSKHPILLKHGDEQADARRDCRTRLFFFFFFFFISLIADGPHHYHPACGHKGSSHLSPVHALQFFLSRCKFSTLTTRQPMVELYLLTFPRFPLRKKEHKSYFGKHRTHDFRTSRFAAYLLLVDHSGDELQRETKFSGANADREIYIFPQPVAPVAQLVTS